MGDRIRMLLQSPCYRLILEFVNNVEGTVKRGLGVREGVLGGRGSKQECSTLWFYCRPQLTLRGSAPLCVCLPFKLRHTYAYWLEYHYY